MTIERKNWGNTKDGGICLYTISNGVMSLSMTNYGCTITDIIIANRNIIAGYSTFEELEQDPFYMGSLVGRYAGRIKDACFTLNGAAYKLSPNDGNTGHHLHGGERGFNSMVFKEVSSHSTSTFAALTFSGVSNHLDEGYPGKVDLTVTITLNTDNEIIFSYYARTNQPTHLNLTHHLYYNLNGREKPSAQSLRINAAQMVETTEDYIPTGRIIEIPEASNFAVRKEIPPDAAFNECYVVNQSKKMRTVAELTDRNSSLKMEVATTCPGLIFYSGQFLSAPFAPRQAICLETQYYPDSPHHPGFPSTLYDAHSIFNEYTKLSFHKTDLK